MDALPVPGDLVPDVWHYQLFPLLGVSTSMTRPIQHVLLRRTCRWFVAHVPRVFTTPSDWELAAELETWVPHADSEPLPALLFALRTPHRLFEAPWRLPQLLRPMMLRRGHTQHFRALFQYDPFGAAIMDEGCKGNRFWIHDALESGALEPWLMLHDMNLIGRVDWDHPDLFIVGDYARYAYDMDNTAVFAWILAGPLHRAMAESKNQGAYLLWAIEDKLHLRRVLHAVTAQDLAYAEAFIDAVDAGGATYPDLRRLAVTLREDMAIQRRRGQERDLRPPGETWVNF